MCAGMPFLHVLTYTDKFNKPYITFNTKHGRFASDYFENIGIKIKNVSGISVFDIGENDKRWIDIRKFIDNHSTDIRDFQFVTQFTKTEMDNSDFFRLSPKWHHQYPQPDDFGYEAITYDATRICSKCGIERKQIAPFSIERNPKWGKRNIVQLYWVHDEYFVFGDLKSLLENEYDTLNFKPVIKYKSNKQLDDVYQLDITQAVGLNMPDVLSFKICDLCKRKKYLPHTRGFSLLH